MSQPLLVVRLLGEFQVTYASQPLSGFNSAPVRNLFAYLLLHQEAPVFRQELAFQFWPDSSEAQARTNLRHLVHGLRGALPNSEQYLVSSTQTINWNAKAPILFDVEDFIRLAARTDSSKALQEAEALYRGKLLAGQYPEWILMKRERLEQLYRQVLVNLSAYHEEQGSFIEAIQTARRLLQTDPLSEPTYRLLMRLHARQGDRAGVMRVYETCADVLEREFGVLPDSDTQAAYLFWIQPGQGDRFYLQTSVLKDSTRPQVNLPAQLTTLIGRKHELGQVVNLISSHRLVTITGFGGVGKTRLAHAAATTSGDFPDGVWWIDLALVTDATMIPRLIASTLKIQEQAGISLKSILADSLSDKRLLLLIDNCEHLLVGAAEVIIFLLQNCPGLHILATSRVSLRLTGELVFPLGPLPVPEILTRIPAEADLNVSIRLFVERATAVLPTFSLKDQNIASVCQICRRVDGIPLAIELAAGRIKLFTAQQIAGKLDEAFRLLVGGGPTIMPRHQTLQATMDWSYSLLSIQEQVYHLRLSIFAGTFTLEAAETICSDIDGSANPVYIRAEQVLQLVSNLVDHSLVAVEEYNGETRYRLHEVCRQYARQKLEWANELGFWADRHLAYYCKLAQEAETNFHCPEQLEWLRRLDLEYDNLRAALNWGLNHIEIDKVNQALHVVESLWLYWYIRGHFVEGLEWAERSLLIVQAQANRGTPVDPIRYGRILYVAASFTFFMAEIERADQYTIASLATCQESNDPIGMVVSLHHSGLVNQERGNSELARQDLMSGLELGYKLGIDWLVVMLLIDLGHLARMNNNPRQAKEYFYEGLPVCRRDGDRWAIMYILNNLADIAIEEGELALARDLSGEALLYSQELGDARGIGFALDQQGQLAFLQQRLTEARQQWMEALIVFWKVRDRDSVMLVIGKLAQVIYALGNPLKASRLLGALSAGRQRYRSASLPSEIAENDSLRLKLCQEIGEPDYDSAWRQGERLELGEIIQELLGEGQAFQPAYS